MATAERVTYVLSCTECKNKNYYFAKGKKKDYKVEVNKFCKKCGKQTVHKESKASKQFQYFTWERRLTGKPPVSKTGTEGSSPSAPARF